MRLMSIPGGLIMLFVAVDDGTPVISEKKDDEKSIIGLTAVIAAVSFLLGHLDRFTYTHQQNESTCPRSCGV